MEKKNKLNTRKLIRGTVGAVKDLRIFFFFFKEQCSYKAHTHIFKLWEYIQHLYKTGLILKAICCRSATCKNQGTLKNSVYLTSLLCVGVCVHLHLHMHM